MRRTRSMRRREEGMALVLTLAVLALITAVVVEFASAVYVNTESLHNWSTAKRLSLLAKSGVNIAAKVIADNVKDKAYTYPGSVDIPVGDPFGGRGADDTVDLRIEDESSKFNLNTIVFARGEVDEEAYKSFERLLEALEIEGDIAARIADWIDRDELPLPESKDEGLKNAPMESTDELLLVPGIGRQVYDKLIPYVTVYGDGQINLNGAEAPVLIALDESMTSELAQRIIDYRELKPFEHESHLQKVAGFEGQLGTNLMGSVTVMGDFFRIHSAASSEDGISRIVDCVIDTRGRPAYWKEF